MMLSKFGDWIWRDIYRLPIALFLWPLVIRNYSLRARHILPDEWYWADERLFKWGYALRSFSSFRFKLIEWYRDISG